MPGELLMLGSTMNYLNSLTKLKRILFYCLVREVAQPGGVPSRFPELA